MSFRVTQNNFFNNTLFNLQNNQRIMDDILQQLSTGKKIHRPSDEPVQSTQLLGMKTDLKELETYQNNIKSGLDLLSVYDNILGQGQNIANRARALAIQGSNDTLEQDDRELIAEEVDQLLEQAIELANTKFEGKFVFGGGEQLDSPFNGDPFVAIRDSSGNITEVQFRGNKKPILREVNENQNVQVNIFGDEAFYAQNEVVRTPSFIGPSGSATLSVQNPALSINRFVPSAATEGRFRINGVDVYYDKDGIGQLPNNNALIAGDSLISIANRINESNTGVTARVSGRVIGYAAYAATDQPINNTTPITPSTNGDNGIVLNGTRIVFDPTNDTLDDIVARINNVSSQTDVRASIMRDSSGLFHLALNGPVVIEDVPIPGTQPGIFTALGITNSDQAGVSAPQNLVQTAISSNQVSDPSLPLSTLFGGVVNGSITINGVAVPVTVATDSLTDLANNISALVPGVTAFVDNDERLVLNSSTTSPVSITADTTDILLPGNLGMLDATDQFIGNRGPAFQLELTSNTPSQIEITDVEGNLFSSDLDTISTAGTPANNFTASAELDRVTLFDALIRLRDDLRGTGIEDNLNQPDTYEPIADIRDEDIAFLDNYLDNAARMRAKTGARVNRLEQMDARLSEMNLVMTDSLSRMEDVDLSALVSDLQKQQLLNQASLAASSRVLQTSLLDFL